MYMTDYAKSKQATKVSTTCVLEGVTRGSFRGVGGTHPPPLNLALSKLQYKTQ